MAKLWQGKKKLRSGNDMRTEKAKALKELGRAPNDTSGLRFLGFDYLHYPEVHSID